VVPPCSAIDGLMADDDATILGTLVGQRSAPRMSQGKALRMLFCRSVRRASFEQPSHWRVTTAYRHPPPNVAFESPVPDPPGDAGEQAAVDLLPGNFPKRHLSRFGIWFSERSESRQPESPSLIETGNGM
jgi:hypothetical protein